MESILKIVYYTVLNFNSQQFNSIHFIQFHQIHYESKRRIGYRISCNTLYQTLYITIQSIQPLRFMKLKTNFPFCITNNVYVTKYADPLKIKIILPLGSTMSNM